MNFLDTIAIDGPAASGKTTVGQMLAESLDYLFLDTGSMYRAVTLAALRQGLDITAEPAVTALAQRLEIEILPAHHAEDGRAYTVLIDGEDVTWQLRSAAVDANVSAVSAYPGVRKELVRRQRGLARLGRVVMVGRDIGTVVLPDAPLKFYVTASAEERARRRYEERRERDDGADYDEILADVNRRDQIDSTREHSPLRPAPDAIILDTTSQAPETVVEKILALQGVKQAAADKS